MDTLRRVADGTIVLEPDVVSTLLAAARHTGPLAQLTDERPILALIPYGHSSEAIGERIGVRERRVEPSVAAIFRTRGLR